MKNSTVVSWAVLIVGIIVVVWLWRVTSPKTVAKVQSVDQSPPVLVPPSYPPYPPYRYPPYPYPYPSMAPNPPTDLTLSSP